MRRELDVDAPLVMPYLNSPILRLVGEHASARLHCVVIVSAPQDLDRSNGAEAVEQITKIVGHLFPSVHGVEVRRDGKRDRGGVAVRLRS
jgi:hypothetical protein